MVEQALRGGGAGLMRFVFRAGGGRMARRRRKPPCEPASSRQPPSATWISEGAEPVRRAAFVFQPTGRSEGGLKPAVPARPLRRSGALSGPDP